jgi:hypothetical protein
MVFKSSSQDYYKDNYYIAHFMLFFLQRTRKITTSTTLKYHLRESYLKQVNLYFYI